MSCEELKKIAFSLINDKDQSCNNSNFYKIFSFSTENLSDSFSKDLFYKKDVLLTGSSADQLLIAQLYNSNKITCFDINPFVQYMYEFKLAAIKCLEMDEFLQFFYYCYISNDSFDYTIYQKIRVKLHGKYLDFWDYLYENFGCSEIRSKLFFINDANNNPDRFKDTIPYLNDCNFQNLKTKDNFCEIEYLWCDVMELPKKLKTSYDTIYFSNIFSRLEMLGLYDNKYIKTLYNFMSSILACTKENGNILLDYFYAHTKDDFDRNTSKTFHVRFPVRYFKREKNMTYKEIPSTLNSDTLKDVVLIYTKK